MVQAFGSAHSTRNVKYSSPYFRTSKSPHLLPTSLSFSSSVLLQTVAPHALRGWESVCERESEWKWKGREGGREVGKEEGRESMAVKVCVLSEWQGERGRETTAPPAKDTQQLLL